MNLHPYIHEMKNLHDFMIVDELGKVHIRLWAMEHAWRK